MKKRLIGSFAYFKRDALAGIVTGTMAVPLTIGICLMSDYPVMMGLYTVIFACVIGFVTFLFRPGNYVGTPGVAAGLAPALALGVHAFGVENMPFLIFLTSAFQAIVWRFRLEKYILKLVPHYLVEGLLAGVGLKIAVKFIPFLYDIQTESEIWFSTERGSMILLSIVSLILFLMLYKSYKKNMPALPYFVIMASAIGLSLVFPLAKLSIQEVPFSLGLPLPDFSGLSPAESTFTLVKMVGFAMMLGTIDVIEQVMSNVAIEKLDPLKRECDSNNSLFAIWIANMGASFFGGMTNLDGLAKSTTNAVAGAMTKLSNLFTAAVLLTVVLIPSLITLLPKYALGVIMVYSGWKMIANLANARTDGRYALIMAAIVGLLVYQLGIFEGLLIVLAVHGAIQVIFMRRLGRSNKEILNKFKKFFKSHEAKEKIARFDRLTEPEIPVLHKFIDAVNTHDINAVLSLFEENSVVLSSLSQKPRRNIRQIEKFYKKVFERMDHLVVELQDVAVQTVGHGRVDTGHYKLTWQSQGFEETAVMRFSIMVEDGKIISLHSSGDPSDDISDIEEGDFVM